MKKLLLFTLLLISAFSKAQTITGKITTSKGAILPFTNILIKNSSTGITSDENGVFILENISLNNQKKVTLIASAVGFMSSQKKINISKEKVNTVNFSLTEHAELLDQITVTGTRTDRRSTKKSCDCKRNKQRNFSRCTGV
ncbi:carboxypeptidase-like regulatory domain-containing protein [Tenacibaculum dicentrarchi]|nr:carboxypeptidase-like regulatory domain-containing protein [Tenacibaculum dicentrarchi]